jgi:uncharacterized protein involved in outer membrane biogenesis
MSRVILIPIAAVLLLAVAALLLVTLFLDKDKVLEIATTQLHKQTGATLSVAGETSLSLFPVLGVSLQDAAIAMPGETEPGLRAQALSIGVQLWPLFSGNVEIDSLLVDGLFARVTGEADTETIDTSRMSDRELDAFYAARRAMREQAGASAGAAEAIGLPLALNVGKLLLTNARIESVDAGTGEVSVVEIPRFEARNLNLAGTPIPLSMTLKLVGEQAVLVSMEGAVKVDQAAQRVTLDGVDVQITGATAEPLGLKTRGDVDISRQVADLELAIELGTARGDGTLRFANYESPQIDTQLAFDRASPALFALAGPEAAAEAAEAPQTTDGDAPLPLDAMRLIDTRAELAIGQLEFQPHELRDVDISLRAVEGVITVDRFTGVLHDGRLDLTARFDGRHNTAVLESTGKLESLDIATALHAMESAPLFSGSANLEWTVTGRGRTANELIAALEGPINLTTDSPILRGTSVEAMLCEAVALVNQERLTTAFPADTRFQELGAALSLADGKLNLQPLKATLPGVQLSGTGNLDLLSQDFKTTFKARLSPELENLDRACRVSKRLTAIDWPVRCKGNTADEPAKWCRVDTDAIIEDLATNEAKRQIEKEAGKLLDKLFK